jgi:autotransporter translocation and assembly factor TamB
MLALVGLAVAVVGMLSLLVFTEAGSARLLSLAGSWTPLEMDYRGGSIAGELELSRFRLEAGPVSLDLEDVVLELRPACLLRASLCVHRLAVDSLEVVIAESDKVDLDIAEPGPPAAGEDRLITLPVEIQVDSLEVAATRVAWPGGEWRQGGLAASLSLGEPLVRVETATVVGAELRLPVTQEQKSVRETIDLPRIYLPLELRVEELTLVEPAWDIAGARHRHALIQLRGKWQGTELKLQRLAVASEGWGAIDSNGQLEFDGAWPLAVAADLASGESPQLPPLLRQRNLDLQAAGSLADLQLALQMTGRASLDLTGSVDTLDPDLPFELNLLADMTEPLALDELLEIPAGMAGVELDRTVTLEASGSLAQQRFEFGAGASGLGYSSLVLELAGSHGPGRLQLERLELADEAGENQLRAAGELDYGEITQWEFALETQGLDLPLIEGGLPGRLQGSMRSEGRIEVSAWALSMAEVDLRGEVNGLPASASGAASLSSNRRLAGSDLYAEINGAQLRLLAQQAGRPGLVELQVDDLGLWLEGGRGRVDLNGVLAADLSELAFEGSLGDIEWQSLEVQSGRISGAVALQGGHEFSLETVLVDIERQGLSLDELRLTAQGDEKSQHVRLDSAGDFAGSLHVKGAVAEGSWRGSLLPASWQTPTGPWRLEETVPLAWSVENSQLSVAGHCWRDRQSELCPGDLLLGASGRASVTGQGRLGRLAVLLPEQIDVNGKLQFQGEALWGAPAGLAVEADATMSELEIVRDYGAGHITTARWEGLRLATTGRDGAWRGELELRAGPGQLLRALAELAAGEGAALTGQLEVSKLQLSELAPFFLELSELKGSLDGQLALSGSLQNPLLDGRLQLTEGRLGLLGNPTVLEELELLVMARGDHADLRGRAMLGGGEMQLVGEVQRKPQPRLELAVVGGKHEIVYPPAAQALISEDLKLVAVGGKLTVAGDIVVHEGKLQHEQLPPGSVGVSSDVVEVDVEGDVIGQGSPLNTELDVWLRVRDDFQVVGNGLDARVGGAIQIRQRPGRPLQLFGNLNIIGGRLEAYKQNLQIKRGTIGFVGAPENPELNVRAQREIVRDNVTVGVSLLGTLENPLIEVYSDPAMSETEALSYLARGRGLDSGAAADGTALALSMGTSLVNQTGVLSNLERIPGLSNIQLGSEGSADDTAATVSGYIADRIFISYGIGIYEPINVLVARLYLQTSLWLEVVSRLENSVDLYYSFDID